MAKLLLAWSATVLSISAPTAARAQITEPNGVVVPGLPNTEGETPLWDFFEAEGEGIEAVADASIEPSIFSPLCDFEVALVMSASNSQAGLAWYNAPTEPTAAPAAVYQVLAPGTPVGQVIGSASIRNDANYQDGLVGFALMKNGQVAYYSEYRRNVFCTNCAAPDHWKMALSYPSTVYANTYYLAFEDWEGATDSTWHQNDGDFNDKVFRITGVSCPGGGEPCDTGQPGVCAPGLTECQFGGEIVCKPQVADTPEVCDGLDNDCNGDTDDGELCAADEICDKGRCVKRCGEVLVTCTSEQVCNDAGYCVDATCADVDCPSGEVCFAGECHEPCEAVVCPGLQVCLAGRCADPCDGVDCEPGRVCERGVCVLECDCQVCAPGLECASSGQRAGHCVDEGCTGQTCAEASVCRGGACVDSCTGARCPRGEKCAGGACVDSCTDVICETGQKCSEGVCGDSCSNVVCVPGFKCVPGDDNRGECVDGCIGVDCGEGRECVNGSCGTDCLGVTCSNPGEVCRNGSCVNPCATMTCAATEVCRDGACTDRCSGVTCLAGQTCENGICVSTGGAPDAPDAGATAPMDAGTTTGSGGSPSGLTERGTLKGQTGCGCRLTDRAGSQAALLLLLFGGALARRRRSRSAA